MDLRADAHVGTVYPSRLAHEWSDILMSQNRMLQNAGPSVCACVCTHNGAATLPECLNALAGQTLDPRRFSVLIVDDGSTDATPDVARRWQAAHPHLNGRSIRQAPSGLSAARNAGIREANAPIVAYIDDDAFAAPGWLEGIVDAFEAFPAAAAMGGEVRVRWSTSKPRWWHDELDEVFNRFRPADEPMTLDFPRLPYGCNFAVRRDTAIRLGGFRTDLGRQGGALLAAEETDLLLRILEAGHPIAYWPSAMVEHLAMPSRLSRRYVLRRAWNHGRSLGRIAPTHPRLNEAMPPFGSCVWRMVGRASAHGFRLAHWKYWLLRLGYHHERRRVHRHTRGEFRCPSAGAEVPSHG